VTAMSKKLLLAAQLFAVGCAGSFNGTVGGESMTVNDSVFMPMKSGDKTVGVIALMSDQKNICDRLRANREPHSAKWVLIDLYEFNGGQSLYPQKGEFSVGSTLALGENGKHAVGEFRVSDETCSSKQDVDTNSGLVKVSHVELTDDGSFNATWDITFGDEQVKGSINATFCDFDWAGRRLDCE
jgi:hypothetical protein